MQDTHLDQDSAQATSPSSTSSRVLVRKRWAQYGRSVCHERPYCFPRLQLQCPLRLPSAQSRRAAEQAHAANVNGYGRMRSRNRSQTTLRRRTRRIALACGRCNRLCGGGMRLADARNCVELQDALFDDFFPAPSLSTTSSFHTTRGRFLVRCRGPPRKRSVPTSPSSSPEGSPSSSSRGCESRIVIVREPSVGADAEGLCATYDMLYSEWVWCNLWSWEY